MREYTVRFFSVDTASELLNLERNYLRENAIVCSQESRAIDYINIKSNSI